MATQRNGQRWAILRIWKERVPTADGRSSVVRLRASLQSVYGLMDLWHVGDWRTLKRFLRDRMGIEVKVTEKEVPIHVGYANELPLELDVAD
jgi:hypothetical protein